MPQTIFSNNEIQRIKENLYRYQDKIDNSQTDSKKDIFKNWNFCKSNLEKIINSTNILKLNSDYKLICLSHKDKYATLIFAVSKMFNQFNKDDYFFEVPKSTFFFNEYPKPRKCLDSYLEAINGNGTHLSYLYIIILSMYLDELEVDRHGFWQGCVIDALPKDHPEQKWIWEKNEPKSLAPIITENDDEIIAHIYTYNKVDVPIIYENIYKFRNGNYSYNVNNEVIARGDAEYGIIV